MLRLALQSAWSRRGVLAWVVLSLTVATLLLAGLERFRWELRAQFASAVSGTDLIVGPRTGATQLLMSSVFRLGAGTSGVSWKHLQEALTHRAVEWVVPLSIGDSHRGFPVLGTTTDYFARFRFGDRRPLVLATGERFAQGNDGLFQAVLGAEVAQTLRYTVGSRLTLSHGTGTVLEADQHADQPFVVVGILERTGTPVDRTVHVSLESIEAIHDGWIGGVRLPSASASVPLPAERDWKPTQVTAALVGLRSRAAVFSVQRAVSEYADAPLMAILPGVVLSELWESVAVGERALQIVAGFVAGVSLISMVAVMQAGMAQRKRELSILRSVGASPGDLARLLLTEGAVLGGLSVAAGLLLVQGMLAALQPWLLESWGLSIHPGWPRQQEWMLAAALGAACVLSALLPAVQAYRWSLADGLRTP